MKKDILEKFEGIEKNIILKDFTTYKIGGPAKYFFNARSKEDLLNVLKVAKDAKVKTFILGGGSNLLISDKGFNGLVIKISISNVDINDSRVFVGAGVTLTKIAQITAENGLSGLEWSAGIPMATIGGAVYGHAQAFGTKTSDNIEFVEVIDTLTLEVKKFDKSQCEFSLKNSIFKKNKNLVIVGVGLLLEKKDAKEVKDKIFEYLKYRKDHHPIEPSAGSTFVNPEIKIENKKLLEKFEELKNFNEKGVIPAGYLIEKSGLQGLKIGGAQISQKHANFIINLENAKAKDVLALIKLAQKKVKKIFNIKLEPEVQIL